MEYEFRLVTAAKEAEKVIIDAKGKAESNRILSASLTDKILQDKGIEATIKLAESPNSKVIVIGTFLFRKSIRIPSRLHLFILKFI